MATEVTTPQQVAQTHKASGGFRDGTPEANQLTRIADILDCIRQELVAIRTSIDTTAAP